MNSTIAEHLSRFDQGLHHIKELHLRLRERLDHIVVSQNEMHEKLSYLIGRKNDSFSCVGTIMSPIGREFDFDDEEKEEGKMSLKRRRGQWLPSVTYEAEKTAKSPSMPKRSKDQDKTSPKPLKCNTHGQEETEHLYYKKVAPRQRDKPAAVNLAAGNHGAHAGLKNSNVNCYSNAILRCIASCICFSDFSPSENHPQFPLNHTFASQMNSMVGSEMSIDPSLFMSVFMPLFRPPEENITEQEGM